MKALKKSQSSDINELISEIILKWKKICSKDFDTINNNNNNKKNEQKSISNAVRADSNLKSNDDLKKSNDIKVEYFSDNNNSLENKFSSKLESSMNDDKFNLAKDARESMVPKPSQPLSNIFSLKDKTKMFDNIGSAYVEKCKELNTNSIEDDNFALENIMKNKKTKHMLYTGKKFNSNVRVAEVPKLYDLSIKVLINTLDDLPNRISIYSKLKKNNFNRRLRFSMHRAHIQRI